MDGVEIAESLLYKDYEKFSTNKLYTKPINNIHTCINVNENYNNLYFDPEIKIQMKLPNYVNLNEINERKLIETKTDNDLLDRLMQQLNVSNSETKYSEKTKIHSDYNFRPISPKEIKNKRCTSNMCITQTALEETNSSNASENCVFQELLAPRKHSVINEISSYQTKTTNSSDLNEIVNATLSNSFENHNKFDGQRLNKSNAEDKSNNSMLHLNNLSKEEDISDNKSNLTKLETIKSEHFVSIPQGSYIFLPVNMSSQENKSHSNEIQSIPVLPDSQIPNNSNKYLITCYPVITQLQDLKINHSSRSPIIVPKNFINQKSSNAAHSTEPWNPKSFQNVKNTKYLVSSTEQISNKKICETRELGVYLEYIIESHQLLIKEKNKLISEMNVMKDDKFKSFVNFNTKHPNNISSIDKELNSLINTLFEINVFISKIETRRDIHFIEPFYQLLQNSAEIIQNFQYNNKDDVLSFLKNQNEQSDQELQLKFKKLKQLYIYIQEVRSFLWAATQNVREIQDTKSKQSLRNLKLWLEEKKNWKINDKMKDNMNLSNQNTNLFTDVNSSAKKNSVKIDYSNVSSIKYGASYYQAINPGQCITSTSAFLPVQTSNQIQTGGLTPFTNQPFKLLRGSTVPTALATGSSISSNTPALFLTSSNNNTIKAIVPQQHLSASVPPGTISITSSNNKLSLNQNTASSTTNINSLAHPSFHLPFSSTHFTAASQPTHLHQHPQLYTSNIPSNNSHNNIIPSNRNFLFTTPSHNIIQAPPSFIYHHQNPNMPGNPQQQASIINNAGPLNYIFYKTNPTPFI